MFPYYFNGAGYKSFTLDDGVSPIAIQRDTGAAPLALANLGLPLGFYTELDASLNQPFGLFDI